MNYREGFYLKNEKWPLPLNDDEIRELFKAYHAGNYDAKRKIFMHNIRFVKVIIYSQFKFKFSDSRNYDEEDLIQVGLIGLYRAIDDYDLSLSYKFTTLAKTYIRSEVGKFLKRQQKHYMECSLQEPDDEYVSHVDYNSDKISREENMPCLYDFTEDSIDDITFEEIKQSFSILNSQEKQVLSLYLGFFGPPLTYQETGKIMGVSYNRVANVYHKALQKLRIANKVDIHPYQRKKSQKL